MARKEKIVEIDGRQIMVREVKTADAIKLLETAEGLSMFVGLVAGFPGDTKKFMYLSVDLPIEQLNEVTEGINGFVLLEQAVREVNADFFGYLEVKINTLIKSAGILEKKLGASLKQPAGSSPKAT